MSVWSGRRGDTCLFRAGRSGLRIRSRETDASPCSPNLRWSRFTRSRVGCPWRNTSLSTPVSWKQARTSEQIRSKENPWPNPKQGPNRFSFCSYAGVSPPCSGDHQATCYYAIYKPALEAISQTRLISPLDVALGLKVSAMGIGGRALAVTTDAVALGYQKPL